MLDRHMLVLAGASTFTIALLFQTLIVPAHAAEGGLKARSGAKTSISRDVARPVARPPAAKAPGRPVTRPTPLPGRGGNTIINKDNDINVNIQGNNHGGGHGYPPPPHHGGNDHHDHHDHWDNWNDWDDHPFATAAAITAGVAVTNAIIGSIVYSVPPECVPVSVNGLTYQRCGNTWYQPQYSGTTIQYIVVVAPI